MVYIDDAKIPYRGMLMCHMFADSIEELHKMADKIGLRRSWFQRGSRLEHYDVCLSKRALAVRHGAILVDTKWVKERIRQEVERINKERRAAHGKV